MSFASRGGNSRGNDHSGVVTEEERLGLVHGDSSKSLPKYAAVAEYDESGEGRDSDEWQVADDREMSSPEVVGMSGDLGKQRRRRDPYDDEEDEGDDLYDRPAGRGAGGRRSFV
jgi:hypothetical protein